MCLSIVSTDVFLRYSIASFSLLGFKWALVISHLVLYASCASNNVTDDGLLPQSVQSDTMSSALSVPSDALLLFDGQDLAHWQKYNGKNAKWPVLNGYMQVKLFAGSIITRKSFGDIQLHVEWATPAKPIGRGQHRGNSGIKLMGRYEIQILDSHENQTSPTKQAGAIYNQHAPLVNASRPPGAWQTYDIIFKRPRFSDEGVLLKPAYVTVFHNGILIQDHAEIQGPTKGNQPYEYHADRLPIELQNHRSKIRFRNVWVRDLEPAL